MNRDYFARPLQGNGRDHWDYGRTSFGRQRDPWMAWTVAGSVLVVVYFVWEFLR